MIKARLRQVRPPTVSLSEHRTGVAVSLLLLAGWILLWLEAKRRRTGMSETETESPDEPQGPDEPQEPQEPQGPDQPDEGGEGGEG